MAAPKGNKFSPGRPKGSVTKQTIEIKEMIIRALDQVGGSDYLVEQAKKNPAAFMGLVSKIIPKDVNNNVSGEIKLVRVATGIPRSPKDGSG